MCDGERGSKRVQDALNENEKGYRGWLKARMGTGRLVELKQFLEEGQNSTLRGVCEGRENRVSTSIGEAPDSVRGLTKVHYSL